MSPSMTPRTLPRPPKTVPWKAVRALQLYDRAERSTNRNRRAYWRAQLSATLDTLTPLALAAYYHALMQMRRGDALPKCSICTRYLHGWCKRCGWRCSCYTDRALAPKRALITK